MSSDLVLPQTTLSRRIDGVLVRLGNATSWLWLLLTGVIMMNVIMRYLFAEGRIEFEEIQWHLYAAGFLLGLAPAYIVDAHIRVDVIRHRFSVTTQAWIELYGTLLLLLPFVLLVLVASFPLVEYSFRTAEVSGAPGGLPYRWFIKSFLTLGFALMLLAVVSRLSRVMAFLFGWPGQSGDASESG